MIKHKEMCATIDENLALTCSSNYELMITLYFDGEKRTLKEMRCLVSPIHDALKLLISSLSISL
jgi:hypothetical protein